MTLLLPIGTKLECKYDQIQSILDYWDGKRLRLNGNLPARSDIDPVEIASQDAVALRHVWLLDVCREPLRFRYRLIGTALDEANVKARVGDYLDQFEDPTAEESFHQELCRILDGTHFGYRLGAPRLPHRAEVRTCERVTLPLADSVSGVNMFLSATVYYWDRALGP